MSKTQVAPTPQDHAPRAILESVFASIADSLLVLDTELCVVDANAQVLRQLGRPKSDVVGRAWEQLFPHLAETGRVADLRMVLAVGQPHRGRIPVVSAADGTSHLFDVATYPVCDPQTGRVTHLVEYAREITEEVKMQLQVMDAHSDLLRVTEQLEEKSAQVDAANGLLQEKCVLTGGGERAAGEAGRPGRDDRPAQPSRLPGAARLSSPSVTAAPAAVLV